MSASSKIPAKHVLRGILRRLKINQAELPEANRRGPGSGATMKYVLDRYRADKTQREISNEGKDEKSKYIDQELRKMAYEYMNLRQDMAEVTRLQKLDTGAEKQLSPREMSRRAAARAGLQLPEIDPDLPSGLDGSKR